MSYEYDGVIYRRGDVRPDGQVYFGKSKYKGEYRARWISKRGWEITKARTEAYHQKWQDANREKLNKRSGEWSKKNRDKIIAYRSRPEVKKLITERRREYRKNNPLLRVSHTSSKRMKEGAVRKSSPETRFLYKFCKAISAGSGVQHHVDHIKPLAKGGSHTWDNLRVIPAVVNMKKGAKLVA